MTKPLFTLFTFLLISISVQAQNAKELLDQVSNSYSKIPSYYIQFEIKDGNAKVHFWPKTGRTHQLRVHAAHKDGLNRPITGDELYGKPAERLCMHAGLLEFKHPESGEWICFEDGEEF